MQDEIMAIVNDWESTDKSEFIEDILGLVLTSEQRQRVYNNVFHGMSMAVSGED